MKKLNGHIVINEKNKVFYVKEEDSVDLSVLRVLEGKKFMVIDLSKVNDDATKYLEKICDTDKSIEFTE